MLALIFITSCTQKSGDGNQEIKRRFRTADSLVFAGKLNEGVQMIKDTRSNIPTDDPYLVTYYCYQAQQYMDKPKVMNIYADSALAFFSDEGRVKQYPNEYYKALIVKGDGCLRAGKYITALNYYSRSKNVPITDTCDDGSLITKIAAIYYGQRNYRLAAQYWAESYNHLGGCKVELTPRKLFFMKQGALDNAGFAYEQAGLLDSANYYYQLDLKLMDEADKSHFIESKNLQAAHVVLFDNLGGLNLKQGKIATAENYLTKSLAIPIPDVDGMKVPPMLKLANLYLKTGKDEQAVPLFNKSRALLNLYGKDNPELEINWNKLYAQYFYQKKELDKAYQYQTEYVRLRDLLEKNSSDLYKIDVQRELLSMRQNQNFIELEQKNKIKKIYIIGFGIAGMLCLIIIILINRSLKETRSSHKDTTRQNVKLRSALDELERVNKNYIRIMRVMAHDLRNPLSGMTGLASMMLGEEDFSEENKHMLQLIETTGMHTMEMINELLKSGLADENEKIVKQTLDLNSLLFDSVELLQFKAMEKDQQLIFESDQTPAMAEVNHEKIWRVLNNLIVNAIKFSHPGGTIRVGTKQDAEHVTIYISDNGIGIPDKDKNNVFEMFTPAKKVGTNGEQPFGLGLSISKKIIEKHNGRIWFESNHGTGTIFYIELPALL